jgi:hypothetical protein
MLQQRKIEAGCSVAHKVDRVWRSRDILPVKSIYLMFTKSEKQTHGVTQQAVSNLIIKNKNIESKQKCRTTMKAHFA